MSSSPFAYPLRIFRRTLSELSQHRLLYSRPYAEDQARIQKWKGLSPRAPQSILVVQLADIGDLVITSVFLRELRKQFPLARITLAVAPFTACYARLCPHVDAVEEFDFKSMAGPDWKQCLTGCEAWWNAGHAFRERVFGDHPPDLAFTVRTHRDAVQVASQILLSTSRAFRRVGYPLKTLFGVLRSTHLLDEAVPHHSQGHEVERQVALLRTAGLAMEKPGPADLWTSGETENRAEEVWRSIRNVPEARYVGLGIGAGRPEKCWPPDHFARLLHWLESDQGYIPLILGGPADHVTAEAVIREALSSQAINLAGKLPLEITAAFIKKLDLFVGNDSGPMHLAAAAGIPVLGIFGPEEPERWGPWPPAANHLSLSAPHQDLQCLLPELVQKSVLALKPRS